MNDPKLTKIGNAKYKIYVGHLCPKVVGAVLCDCTYRAVTFHSAPKAISFYSTAIKDISDKIAFKLGVYLPPP